MAGLKMKRLFYWYQLCFWYIGMANGEIRKPLVFTNETLQLLTFLAVIGIRTNIWYVVGVYVAIMVLMVVMGKLYVISGAPKYLARVSNQQNPEFMKILSELKEIKEKLNEDGKI